MAPDKSSNRLTGIPRIKLTKWRNFMFGKARPAQRGRPGPFKGPTAEEPAAAPRSPFTAKKGTAVILLLKFFKGTPLRQTKCTIHVYLSCCHFTFLQRFL